MYVQPTHLKAVLMVNDVLVAQFAYRQFVPVLRTQHWSTTLNAYRRSRTLFNVRQCIIVDAKIWQSKMRGERRF